MRDGLEMKWMLIVFCPKNTYTNVSIVFLVTKNLLGDANDKTDYQGFQRKELIVLTFS